MALSDSRLRFIFSEFSLRCISWTLLAHKVDYLQFNVQLIREREEVKSLLVVWLREVHLELSLKCFPARFSSLLEISPMNYFLRSRSHHNLFKAPPETSVTDYFQVWTWEVETTWDFVPMIGLGCMCVGVTNWINWKVFQRISSTQRELSRAYI